MFIVSIRKDIDNGMFHFPKPFPLERRLKDVLDPVVDEKFYLDGKFETIARANDNYSMLCGGVIGKMHDISRRVYSPEYVSPSLHTCGGGNLEPKVAVAMRGRYNKEGVVEQSLEVSGREFANAITTVQKDSLIGEPKIIESFYKSREPRVYEEYAPSLRSERYGLDVEFPFLRVRKLTPRECFRLMGFDDESFHRAEAVNSNTQLYKQAGNSIVVDVLKHLFRELIESGVFWW